jgi:hypothetical protein
MTPAEARTDFILSSQSSLQRVAREYFKRGYTNQDFMFLIYNQEERDGHWSAFFEPLLSQFEFFDLGAPHFPSREVPLVMGTCNPNILEKLVVELPGLATSRSVKLEEDEVFVCLCAHEGATLLNLGQQDPSTQILVHYVGQKEKPRAEDTN